MFGFFNQPTLVPLVPKPTTAFNHQSSNDLEVIKNRIERFKQAQAALQATDGNIARGLVFGGACWVGIYLFPLVTVSIVSFCFATYNAARRPDYYKQYKQALEDLIDVYGWSMGKNTGNHWEKLGVPGIQDLINTLGPWASKETIHTWGPDDLKSRDSSPQRADFPKDFETKLAQFAAGAQTSSWEFRVYGEGGGAENIIASLQTALTRKITEGFTSMMLSASTPTYQPTF